MINACMRVMEDHLEIKFEEGKKGQPKKLLFVNKKKSDHLYKESDRKRMERSLYQGIF